VLTTAEASKAILAAMPASDSETLALASALGRVLRQRVRAERDQPPFDRVTMDGIAIKHSAFANGLRRFHIQDRQHAGDPRVTLADDDNCIEIMTGAVLPEGCDCVIPVERTEIVDDSAEIESGYEAGHRQFIHPRASDHVQGQQLLDEGHLIAPADIAVIASCGQNNIAVSQQPSICVISTGDELVAAGEPIADHQIRMSNGPAVVALLQSHGYEGSRHDHLPDDKQQLRSSLEKHLHENRILVLSGGVSMGKADFVPEVLRELGVEVVFHKISQRPGKPMWFGIGPGNQAVFALPGNPVSTLVCCRQYVIPALAQASLQGPAAPVYAALTEHFSFKPALTCFLPVRLKPDPQGVLRATPVATNTSGDFAALSGTAGYVELALNESEFAAGSVWPFHAW